MIVNSKHERVSEFIKLTNAVNQNPCVVKISSIVAAVFAETCTVIQLERGEIFVLEKPEQIMRLL